LITALGDKTMNTTASLLGLSQAEALNRLALEGPNLLPTDKKRGLFVILQDVFKEPMFLMLLASAAIYMVLGDKIDALILSLFASLSVGIAIIQEIRSENVLATLRALSSPRALVIRGGQRQRIAGTDVVRGDILVLAEGDRIPADALVRECHHLFTDESLLTGESVPVRKRLATDNMIPRPGGDDLGAVFSGTLVVRGQALAEVMATGERTEIGHIGKDLHRIETEPPRLSTQTRQLVRACALGGLAFSALIILLYGLMRDNWMQATLGGIALGMSLLPQEFPLVLRVFMVMGARRIAGAHVLTRRAAALEMLGAATVLCTDKTGTLTQNKMTVQSLKTLQGDLWQQGNPLHASCETLALVAVRASSSRPHDPMEQAIHAVLPSPAANTATLVAEYPLTPTRPAMIHVWQNPASNTLHVACKGAPETVLSLCQANATLAKTIHDDGKAMAEQGLRVLAVAQGQWPEGKALPEDPSAFGMTLLGLVGLEDPLRPGVPQAINDAHTAGIRVLMITGDYPETARSIARQAGIPIQNILTGGDLSQMDDAALAQAVRSTTVFARILPEQKLRLVQALKARGDVVAMTGDGVNDAPALKAAHIGIAMGQRGTDVAREAASLVLLKDDFTAIVQTIRLGRRIYDNLKKTMGYIIAVHVPIAGMAALPLPMGWPLLFLPLHMAMLEMIINPVCSLAFEAEEEEADIMNRPPRLPDEPLLSKRHLLGEVSQGMIALLGVASLAAWGFSQNLPEDSVRGLTLLAMIAANFALLISHRRFKITFLRTLMAPGRPLKIIFMVTAVLVGVFFNVPFFQNLLNIALPPWPFLGAIPLMALVVLGAVERIKRARL
jgi:Ca2+-transporting ATPase